MSNTFYEAFETCAKDRIGFVTFSGATPEELERFQSQYRAALDLEDRGAIRIIKINRESMTGRGWVDLIEFRRLTDLAPGV